jgi:predicted NBD/HSP70 family sugar kinase
METSKTTQALSIAAAALFALVAMIAGYRNIGIPPVVIVGGSSVIGMALWIRTYLQKPLDPSIILPPFLLTVAALEVHMAEEYLTGFGPAMSRTFDISWTEQSFLMIFAFIGPAIYSLTALGLYYRVPLAGFLACFIFIGPGVAEISHFVFPLIEPAIQPELRDAVSQTVSNGGFVASMPNYWLHATGTYYFPGMYTAVLPMIPGIWAIVRTVRGGRRARALAARAPEVRPAGEIGALHSAVS